MLSFFYVLAFLLLIQSLLALAATLRFTRYVMRDSFSNQHFQPRAAVIVPCKGVDPGFEENIGSLFAQNYRDYEIIFVTESENDPAYARLNDIIAQSHRAAWLVVAGEAAERGQKIHNLLSALETLDAVNRRAEIIVFADADARPSTRWLAELIAPLADERIGATTGFRWYLPEDEKRIKVAALLLSAWNASALSLLGEQSAFAWGGATAIRRENFEKLGIREQWQNAVSDDYVLTRALKDAGQRIKFVPDALMPSATSATFSELIEFTTRQMKITRVYSPQVWALTLVTHILFNLTFWGSLLYSLVTRQFHFDLMLLIVSALCLGAVNGTLRNAVAVRLLEEDKQSARRFWWIHALSAPLVSLIYLYNLAASVFSRTITWRGISYEMLSPEQTIIRGRQPSAPTSESVMDASRSGQAKAHSTTRP